MTSSWKNMTGGGIEGAAALCHGMQARGGHAIDNPNPDKPEPNRCNHWWLRHTQRESAKESLALICVSRRSRDPWFQRIRILAI